MFLQKNDITELLQVFNGLITKTASPMTLTNIQLISDGQKIVARGVSSGRSIMVQNSIPVQTDQFNILCNFELFSKLIKTHNKTIEFILNQNSLLLKSGKKESEIALIKENFVTFPVLDEDLEFTYLDNKRLHKTLKQVRMTTGKNEFNCVFFNDTEIVASNRFQITVGQFPVNAKFIISAEAVNYLLKVGAKLDSFNLALGDKLVIFVHKNLIIYTNLIGFKFPDYTFVKETNQILTLSADITEMKEGLERIKLFNPDKATLETVEEGLRLTTRGQRGIEESVIPADLDGKKIKMKFSPQVLLNYVNGRKSNRVFLDFAEATNFRVIGLASVDGTHYIPELLN